MSNQNVTKEEVSAAVDKYADMVRRICFLYLRNHADVEDVFQEVFLKYFLNINSINDEEHLKAWLCRVTFNKCKDLSKSFWRKKVVSIENLEIPYEGMKEPDEIVKAVFQLPPEYKEVIYLHYYEDLTIPQIAEIIQKNTNTVYTHLRRAKEILKKKRRDFDC
ncbi:MAG: sigma-70 family RNA polymerase sigma factor [Clostridiaceae bacterium]